MTASTAPTTAQVAITTAMDLIAHKRHVNIRYSTAQGPGGNFAHWDVAPIVRLVASPYAIVTAAADDWAPTTRDPEAATPSGNGARPHTEPGDWPGAPILAGLHERGYKVRGPKNAGKFGQVWSSNCPEHGGKSGTTFRLGRKDNGTAWVKCWAGCEAATMLGHFGMVPADLFGAKATFKCTDLGNSERLEAQHVAELRWCASIGWLAYDGKRWATGEAQARQLAVETVRSIYQEAIDCDNEDARKRLSAWAVQSESAGRINAMLDLARWRTAIHVRPEELDVQPMLLNVLNGTLDLTDGSLWPHRPEDLITKLAQVEYDPGATSEVWATFLAQATAGQDGLPEYLARVTGYSLTGSTDEDVFLVPHGPGGGGKSTFTGTVQAMLGDYGYSLRVEAVTAGSSAGHNDDVAALAGRRMVVAVEASQTDRLKEGLVKSLTGGDQIQASRKNQKGFTFTPILKLWLPTNHVPRVRADDSGIWRRLVKLPFTNVPTIADRSLRRRLKQPKHLRAVLAWAVEGCLAWQRDGLNPPPCVLTATEDLRTSMDGLAEFFEDRCTFAPTNWATSSSIREVYSIWCDERGIPEMFRVSGNRMADGLAARNCTPKRMGHAQDRGWVGVSVFK